MSKYTDLQDYVEENYTSNRLKQLTHIDEASPSIENTRLLNACKEAIDMIEADIRDDFDSTDYDHMHYGQELVIAILKRKTGDEQSKFDIKDTRDALKNKRKTKTANSKFKGFSEDVDSNGNSTSRFDFYFD